MSGAEGVGGGVGNTLRSLKHSTLVGHCLLRSLPHQGTDLWTTALSQAKLSFSFLAAQQMTVSTEHLG